MSKWLQCRQSLSAMCSSFCHMPHCIRRHRFGPKKGQASLWAVSCECDNAHSFAHSLLTRPSSTTRRQDKSEGAGASSSIVLMYAGALIAARLHFVWGQAENLDIRSKPSSCFQPYPCPCANSPFRNQPILQYLFKLSSPLHGFLRVLGHKWKATF